MRTLQFKRLGLVLAVQMILLIGSLFADEPGAARLLGFVCVPAAFLFPFVGNIYALYGAPWLARFPSVAKMITLTLTSVLLTFAGFAFTMVLFMSFGFSIFPSH